MAGGGVNMETLDQAGRRLCMATKDCSKCVLRDCSPCASAGAMPLLYPRQATIIQGWQDDHPIKEGTNDVGKMA